MESATGSHLIFVYGTLKQGQPNHDAYTGDRTHGRVASFACSAETEACYPLVIFTQFNIPAILAAEGQGKHIQGELYCINSAMLEHMDSLEGCPRYYERVPFRVRLTEVPPSDSELAGKQVGDVVDCEVYLFTDFRPELLSDRPHIANFDATEAGYIPGASRGPDPHAIENAMASVKTLTKPIGQPITLFQNKQ